MVKTTSHNRLYLDSLRAARLEPLVEMNEAKADGTVYASAEL